MHEPWLPDLDRQAGSKYQAIAGAIRTAIAGGALRPGDRLPPQRALADRLSVDLTTVTRAYDLVQREGLIEARGRAGSFVRGLRDVVPTENGSFDAWMNMPPDLPGDMLPNLIADTTRALLASSGTSRLQYQPAGGTAQARAAGAALLSGRDIPSNDDQVLVTSGGQHALQAILQNAFSPGQTIACGPFIYSGFKALALRMGLRLHPLPEMTAGTLADACRHHAVRGLYLVPTNDNPTGATVPEAERQAIAQLARDQALQIIEDDAYGPLAADPIPPLAHYAPERCWHIASTSKIISPALRVAFLRAPDMGAALRIAAALHESAIMAPPLNVAMVCSWLADGSFVECVDAMRAEAAWRQRLADEILGPPIGTHARGRHPEGYHFWLPLPAGVTSGALSEAMRPTGLSVVPGERFALEPGQGDAVRVSLGGPISRERLESALRVLHVHLTSPHAGTMPLV